MELVKKAIKNPRKVIRKLFSTFVNTFRFKMKGVEYKKRPYFDGVILISKSKDGRIIFGENVFLNSGRRCNPVGFEHKMMISAAGSGIVEIGDQVGISNAVIYATNHIKIESGVLVGNGVKIFDTDFHSLNKTKRQAGKGDNDTMAQPVTICKNAFVGAGTTILKGVTIGENSIIGACSVVAKNVPPNQVWAGNPARYIRDIQYDE